MDTKYRLVADHLIKAIDRGEYPVGSVLPTLQELTRRFEIARGTARAAIAVLVADGLAVVKQGVGTLVSATTTPAHPPRPAPRREHLQIMLSGWAPAAADVATRLGLPAGSLVVHRIRHHRTGRQVVQVDEQWVPATVAGQIEHRTGHDIADFENTPHTDLTSLMRRANLSPVVALVSVHARMPEHVECATMGIPATTPVLVTHQVVHDSTGKPVETTTSICASDRTTPMLTIPVP